MASQVVLTTTAQLDQQLVRDTLTQRAAMQLIRDWIAEYFEADASIASWTPYWKEIIVRQADGTSSAFRFRLNGPVEIRQSHGWDLSHEELEEFSRALIPLLDELGRAMTQQRVADAVQSQYADASRQVRNDDTILLQFRAPPPTACLGEAPFGPIEMAVIVRHNQTVGVFARCSDETVGRAAIRRFLANIQVAGIPLMTSNPPIHNR